MGVETPTLYVTMRTRVRVELSYIDPESRVLHYCLKYQKQSLSYPRPTDCPGPLPNYHHENTHTKTSDFRIVKCVIELFLPKNESMISDVIVICDLIV